MVSISVGLEYAEGPTRLEIQSRWSLAATGSPHTSQRTRSFSMESRKLCLSSEAISKSSVITTPFSVGQFLWHWAQKIQSS